jgi:hypothetical protein
VRRVERAAPVLGAAVRVSCAPDGPVLALSVSHEAGDAVTDQASQLVVTVVTAEPPWYVKSASADDSETVAGAAAWLIVYVAVASRAVTVNVVERAWPEFGSTATPIASRDAPDERLREAQPAGAPVTSQEASFVVTLVLAVPPPVGADQVLGDRDSVEIALWVTVTVRLVRAGHQ